MKLLSLFSGIGAFEKALNRLNIDYQLVNYCEIDKFASKTYAAIHGVPESLNLWDITKVDEKALPKDIDLITYGFPCQDISLAGKQKGLFNEDGSQTRSGLFFEALRIIEETQPRVAIAENVKNLTSKKFSKQFKIVLDSLEDAGYNNYFQVLNAKDYGIPQNRERVFIVSIRKDIDTGSFNFPEGFPLELRLKDLLEDEVDEKYYLSDKVLQGIKTLNCGRVGKQVAQTLTTSCNQAVVMNPLKGQTEYGWHFEQGVYDSNGITRSIKAGGGSGNIPKVIKENVMTNERAADIMRNEQCCQDDPVFVEAYEKAIEALDKQAVVEPRIEVLGNYSPSNHDASRIVSADGIAPTAKENHGTVTAVAMRGRYAEDGTVEQNIEVSDREYANALTTVQKDSMVAKPICLNSKGGRAGIEGIQPSIQDRVYDSEAIATAVTTGFMPSFTDGLRIRKLTPKECFRLMDFDDEDFDKAESVNSNTQLYKQAGNSIVVACPYYIIKNLVKRGKLNVDTYENM